MNRTGIFLASVLAFQATPAFSLDGPKERSPSSTVEYDDTLKNAKTRASSAEFRPFPAWSKVELIRDGQIDPEWKDKMGVDPTGLKHLQVRDFSIESNKIAVSSQSITFPFMTSVRYQEQGGLIDWREVLKQGTLEIQGLILVSIRDQKIFDIQVLTYADSRWNESLGRSVGLLSKYDGNFGKTLVTNVLSNFLATLRRKRPWVKL